MTSDAAVGEIVRALKSMEGELPSDLMDTVSFFQKKAKTEVQNEFEVVAELTSANPNNPARVRFQLLISKWDAVEPTDWASGGLDVTAPGSAERRGQIYEGLAISEASVQLLDSAFPGTIGPIIIDGREGDWKQWYTQKRQSSRDFYWKAYSGLLEAHGWGGTARATLDIASSSVVRHLADPLWPHPHQSKGLVVGYVQSGKTANFTGVIAKAIDAGYRLIIVLTGTVELLRSQTQRRLDMELVGEENILGAISKSDLPKMALTDYFNDKDWNDGKFLRHGIPIHDTDEVPGIRRLSSLKGDYKRLQLGLAALDFRSGHELADKKLPLYAEANIWRSDVRLAVVKKNSTVLKKLVDDLSEIHADLAEIPALIIDDEADQASVNTRKQNPKSPEVIERTAINGRISELLKLLKRCQYVGYTATPFANVFISPDDSGDIFPKDFIVSLERPVGYMGASDFHDLDVDFGDEPKTVENSNEKDFVRDLWSASPEQRQEELQRALDSFLLSGAIKLYRRSLPGGETFRHHTMLVHESVKQIDHAKLATELRTLWKSSGYSLPAGTSRLRELWEIDYLPVCRAVPDRMRKQAALNGEPEPTFDDMPIPRNFADIAPFIGPALDRIQSGSSPVIVVNGAAEKDYEQDSLDFQGGDVWKILVGGAKLSRGFTVEGLTISYYTRRTQQADTLMQMGRWYGFRPGYRDLVRLFVGRAVPGPATSPVDLYEAFDAVVQDEENFRAELRRFADPAANEGQPQVRPEDVPPMVFQQLPWLKPTATNKMYNAELTTQGVGGRLSDFPMQPDRGDGSVNQRHFKLAAALLPHLAQIGCFAYEDDATSKVGSFNAAYGIIGAKVVLDFVHGFEWTPNYSFKPHWVFMRDLINAGTLKDFAVILPDLKDVAKRPIGSYAQELPILKRARRGADRPGFSGSSKRQRYAIQTIAGARDSFGKLDEQGGAKAVELHTPTRGALLLTFALDKANPDHHMAPSALPVGEVVSPKDIATIFSYALPYDAAPKGKIGFLPKKSGAPAIIDR